MDTKNNASEEAQGAKKQNLNKRTWNFTGRLWHCHHQKQVCHSTREIWIKSVSQYTWKLNKKGFTPKAFLMIIPRGEAFENLYLSGKIGIEETF